MSRQRLVRSKGAVLYNTYHNYAYNSLVLSKSRPIDSQLQNFHSGIGMESIRELCEALESATLDECQHILDSPQDVSAGALTLPDNALIEEALREFRRIDVGEALDSVSTACLKRLCAHALVSVSSNPDQDAKMLSCRLIMVMGSLPSASAFGIFNSNIVQVVIGLMNKLIAGELKGLHQKEPGAPQSTQDSINMNFNLNEDNEEERARPTRSRAQRRANTQDESGSEEDSVDDTSVAGGRRSQSSSAATQARNRLRPQQLQAFIQDARKCTPVLATLSDDFVLSSCADLLVAAMYLAASKPEYAGSASHCQEMLVAFACHNRTSLITTYRSLMPILTLATRNALLPDVAKVKRACHKAALTAAIELINSSCSTSHLLVVETAATSSNAEMDVSTDQTSAPASPSSAPPTPATDRRQSMGSTTSAVEPAAELTLAHTCLVGALQRMVLSPPERAPVRQVLLGSLVDMVTALGQGLAPAATADAQVTAESLKAVRHFLSFLARLSRSSKIAHRAFSLDIAAQLLTTTWLWALPAAESNDDDAMAPCAVLLEVVQERCLDCSPAVRTRAITAVADLLANLSEDSAPAMVTALFEAAMGAKPARTIDGEQSEGRTSLLDTLRERASDDRPQVRSKALQALSAALAMSWPKVGMDGEIERVTMLVTEEDLQVFASRCQDASVLVRKQALQSLTEILTARPADALVQDVWVQSVVPMTFDAEAGVANKVAENLHTLLFDNLMAWFVEQQSAAAETDRTAYTSLVWVLTSKITGMGMFKVLKAALGLMLKQGTLTAAAPIKSDTRSSSVLAVIGALKVACCCHLDTGAKDAQGAASQQSLRWCDAEEVARGAWILLEGLTSLDGMTILNAKQESVKFRDYIRQAGSADFVVRCYRQRHAADTAVVWDEEDLRIFKVLETLGANLAEKDRTFIKSQIMDNLTQLGCECHIAAAAIAVLLQLSKTETLVETDLSSSQEASRALQAAVQAWATPLLNAASGVLHMYALRTRPAAAPGEAIGATTSVGLLMLDWLQETDQSDASLTMDVSTTAASASPSLTSHVLEVVQTALFVLGEVSMLGFSMEEDHFLGTESKKGTNTVAKSAEYFRVHVEQSAIDLVKILMGHALPVAAGGAPRECPNKIRANAFVTMGKLCLRNKTLARAHVNIFLREVAQKNAASTEDTLNVSSLTAASHINAAAAVRSNALLVLGDLCIRYTNLVDRHVDTMAQCLQDTEPIVRKNALILLTQLLLQDYLKWKGFLLYRFLMLTVDADPEIAEFSRNVLQKTLSLKYPGLLSTHFTEALVIFNGCVAHPAYGSIARTGSAGEGALDGAVDALPSQPSSSAMDEDEDAGDAALPEVSFSAHLSRAQRFGIYAFMAEDLDDEGRIQVSAKLVQDVLTAAVDSTTLLPQPSQKGRKAGDREKYVAFENVLEDALALLRSPHLKVGTKKSNDDGDEAPVEDEGMNGAGAAANPKAAFARAKSKVLQKLSTQHLISHTLPVVISLKHALEIAKSPLQGALMEYLVSLVKSHKNEVDEALQFDPTLKAEVEYDLKQFERTKKEKLAAAIAASNATSAKKSPLTAAVLPGTALKAKSPYLDLQQLPANSIVKPSLRKSLGGAASRGRTPFDALKSPGMNLSKSAIRSAFSTSSGRANAAEDDVDRLTFSQLEGQEAAAPSAVKPRALPHRADPNIAPQDINCPTQKLFADDGDVGEPAVEVEPLLLSGHKQSRRRSWGVVVDSLLPSAGTSPLSAGTSSARSSLGSTAAAGSPSKSPPKKKRCRKSNSPKSAGSGAKSVSFGETTEPPSENQPFAGNVAPVDVAPVAGAQKTSKVATRVTISYGGQENSLLGTLGKHSTQDDAVNAFDRLLASSAAEEAAPVIAAKKIGAASRRGMNQKGDSLLSMLRK